PPCEASSGTLRLRAVRQLRWTRVAEVGLAPLPTRRCSLTVLRWRDARDGTDRQEARSGRRLARGNVTVPHKPDAAGILGELRAERLSDLALVGWTVHFRKL